MGKKFEPSKLPGSYHQFYQTVAASMPRERIICDPLRTIAFGTDASFYRLVPKIVLKVESEAEITAILKACDRYDVPATFRAAGTSLSGQAVTDSVLVIAGDSWKAYQILEDGHRIRLQPGIIGAQANSYLLSYGRKIGPDPASINAAMIGGIVANNASGMCCGTSENSYKTLAGLRIILHDGTLLDTADPQSRQAFRATHANLLDRIETLGREVRQNEGLAERIRHKFKIKNTTGYSLNALVDYEDPFDIIAHLMVGSEGTLGFISEVVYHTVVEHPHKASALMIFPDIKTACEAVTVLKQQPVSAVELMDRAALQSVENKVGMPDYLKTLSIDAAALLVETRAAAEHELNTNIDRVSRSLAEFPMEKPLVFTAKPEEFTVLWNIRKGLFPAVGAVRETGTTVIIEDVAFPIKRLAEATLELRRLMSRFAYDEAIIFGHALEGNLHFVFTQDFSTSEEVTRYRNFMHEVSVMVVERYDGSLKAEHGTGRNMAPYVEMEWGREAYELMQAVKQIMDPKNLLNPGVILNDNPNVHVENLKPLPAAHTIVDKCIECGFCEAVCPSKNVTLTPRQRIAVQREISRLNATGQDADQLATLVQDYRYQGDQTCATDGLCEIACPVEINTGDLTKELRRLALENTVHEKGAAWAAQHFGAVTDALRMGIKALDEVHALAGTPRMTTLTAKARQISGQRLPLWNRYMPSPAPAPQQRLVNPGGDRSVVYFPSCIARTMGPAKGDPDQEPLAAITQSVLVQAGYRVLYPEGLKQLCCGMPYASKGLKRVGQAKARELEKALLKVSQTATYPILCDTSPCLYHMRSTLDPRLKLYDPVEFIHSFLLDRLTIQPLPETIAVHTTCSSQKMGLAPKLLEVARRCATEVIVPERVGCCGFAGDRGFTFPELNAAALEDLKTAVAGKCRAGYSNSRTCEIGLSLHSGIHYKSIFYLLARCIRKGN